MACFCPQELQSALQYNKPAVMLIGAADEGGTFLPNSNMCENLFVCVDVMQASASVEADRVRILEGGPLSAMFSHRGFRDRGYRCGVWPDR